MLSSRTLVISVWGAATLLGLWVAAATRIGPVLFTVAGSHGVHLGDVVAFVVVYGAALVFTRRVLVRRTPPRSRPDGRGSAAIGRNQVR
jgi:hypothetical protein